MVLKSKLLSNIPGVIHGFGTRAEPISKEITGSWSSLAPKWKQVHGVTCAEVNSPQQECGEVDALFTFSPGLPIAVVTADCVPILLARRTGGAVAAVHAGWRGSRNRILTELWKSLSSRGESPSEWVASIGPAIGPCCYEVSEELALDFAKAFDPIFGTLAVPRYRTLDLPALNQAELLAIGLFEVELLRACTRCSGIPGDENYHSFRREGGGKRQYSMISIIHHSS